MLKKTSELGAENAVIASMDVLAIGALLLTRRFFKEAVKHYDDQYDAKVTEISDYTIIVTGLPLHESESEVEEGLRECDAMRYSDTANACGGYK
jgi:hypothetical protein